MMKIRVQVPLELTEEQFDNLLTRARQCGHDFDNTGNNRLIVRRYLEDKVRQAVLYANENIEEENDEE